VSSSNLLNTFLGLENAYLASVLHRDVNFGNVMLLDKQNGLKGYLQDLDYSIFVRPDRLGCTPQKCAGDIDKELKDITVTIAAFSNRYIPD